MWLNVPAKLGGMLGVGTNDAVVIHSVKSIMIAEVCMGTHRSVVLLHLCAAAKTAAKHNICATKLDSCSFLKNELPNLLLEGISQLRCKPIPDSKGGTPVVNVTPTD